MNHLPVAELLPEISPALQSCRAVVVHAEPGAGKTMLVPEYIHRWQGRGMTILVEPRRIAARAAAAGIAAIHGFTLGKECGFAVRGEKMAAAETGILAVTPGVMLQMLQHDPELTGVGAVVFDEFHERSLDADLAFTLVLDVREALREDLVVSVMSATLDAVAVGEFLHAPVVSSPGRTFPVDISYRQTSAEWRDLPREIGRAVLENLNSGDGDMLVFLPGAEEIERTAALLTAALPPEFILEKLHGSLPFDAQKKVLTPAPADKRRIILATNVAESSLTLPGIRCVIDSGWEKVPCYRPGAGMTFLEPRRITVDSAVQRSGRAGRTAPGVAVRCWDKFQEAAFAPHARPEILTAELSQLALTLANWGTTPEKLRWLDAPPEAAYQAALTTLQSLGLMDENCRLTPAGKRAAQVPVQLRQAAMMLHAPENMRQLAASCAALLEEKDDFRSFAGADLRDRLDRWHRKPGNFRIQNTIRDRLLREFPAAGGDGSGDPGRIIAAAFPEWIGAARTRHGTEYQLAGGRAAALQENDPLRGAGFLAIARLDGSGKGNAAIRLAVPVDGEVLEELFADRITTVTVTAFDADSGRFTARTERRLGALVLAAVNCPVPEEMRGQAVIREALRRQIQLPPPDAKAACQLLDRIRFGRAHGMTELPDCSATALAERLPEFAAGFMRGVSSFAELKKAPWFEIISAMLSYEERVQLDRLCPAKFTAPCGTEFPIDYSGDVPTLAIQIQQLYGVKVHPCAGVDRMPLKLELLSPAMRPVQITSDLPGFWRGSWSAVAKEMRARYPKHLWADDPENTAPMRRSVKPH